MQYLGKVAAFVQDLRLGLVHETLVAAPRNGGAGRSPLCRHRGRVNHVRIDGSVSAVRLCHVPVSLLMVCAAVAACATPEAQPTAHSENRVPLGVIDTPLDGVRVAQPIVVRGWAGDDRGIRSVRVFVDGDLVGMAEFAWERPDVSAVYPELRHGTDRHGWEKRIDIVQGPHTLRVDVVDIDGAVSVLGQRRVTVTSGPAR
jgi:Bacterial Ig domain